MQSQTHIKAHQGIALPKSHTFPHYAVPETSREFGDKNAARAACDFIRDTDSIIFIIQEKTDPGSRHKD